MTSILNYPSILRLRRIHGIEHATINLLVQRIQGISLAGHSDPNGFWLLGDVPTPAVEQTVQDAMNRMRQGDHKLAIAPLCGTNIVTIGTLTGLAGIVTMWDSPRRLRDKIDRIPLVILMATLATLISLPLGVILQQHVTTDGDPGNLQVASITRQDKNGIISHRVTMRG